METDIEIVNLSDLPLQTDTNFEMLGRDTSSGDAVRVPLDRMVEFLLSGNRVSSNARVTVTASNGAADLKDARNGMLYVVSPAVSKLSFAADSEGICCRVIFTAASTNVVFVSAKRLPIYYLLPIGTDRIIYNSGMPYLMEIRQLNGALVLNVMALKQQ